MKLCNSIIKKQNLCTVRHNPFSNIHIIEKQTGRLTLNVKRLRASSCLNTLTLISRVDSLYTVYICMYSFYTLIFTLNIMFQTAHR